MKIMSRLFVVLFFSCSAVAHAQYLATDLHPSWATYSWVLGVSAFEQVGYASSGATRAMRWQGSRSSAMILGGSSTIYAKAWATDGTQQVGYEGGLPTRWLGSSTQKTTLRGARDLHSYVVTSLLDQSYGGLAIMPSKPRQPGGFRALYWPSLTSYPVVLSPPSSYTGSTIYSLSRDHFGGLISYEYSGDTIANAASWDAYSHGVTNLNPYGYVSSTIRGISDWMGVGWASGDQYLHNGHAGVWDMYTGSFWDAHPWQYYASWMWAVSGTTGAGSAQDYDGAERAMLWDLNTGAITDLHQFLPPGQYRHSRAMAIWVSPGCGGTQIGGYAVSATDGQHHAMLWYTPWC